MKKSIAGLVLFAASFAASALPTTQQVEAAVQQGNYAQAESMMSEVVADKPGSAKAHYVYAEMLAHNGRFAKAADEARRAREIDPAIRFTEADKFRAFEQLLERERSTPARARVAPSVAPGLAPAAPTTAAPGRQGLPGWIWLAGLALVAFVLWRMFSRRAAATAGGMGAAGMSSGAMGAGGPMNPAPYNPNNPNNMNPTMPYGPNAGPGMQRAGGGLLGTGLAVAGGVAGGMMLDRMLHNRGNSGNDALGNVGPSDASGLNPAASELESRPVDFGSGNDWDSAGTSDAGSSDAGGSDGGGWD